jgi:hypothetical protein
MGIGSPLPAGEGWVRVIKTGNSVQPSGNGIFRNTSHRGACLAVFFAPPGAGVLQVVLGESLDTRSMGILITGIKGKVISAVRIGVTGRKGHEPRAMKG